MKARTMGGRQGKGRKQLLQVLFLLLTAGLLLTGCGEKAAPVAAQVKRPIRKRCIDRNACLHPGG